MGKSQTQDFGCSYYVYGHNLWVRIS
jgi:hypothetical protein